MTAIRGLHHVTAICGEPQVNADFYAGVLGLRLVKRTVNFDDPTTYHLYYGDAQGRPGTILTFFPWPGAPRGTRGSGQTTAVAFAVPVGSLDAWMERFAERAVEFGAIEDRLGERVLPVEDPDGLVLELVESPDANGEPWRDGPVPESMAVRGFHSVTLTVEGYERTAALLADVMGFKAAGDARERFRYVAPGDAVGRVIDVVCAPGLRRGRTAAGTIHHIAFRCADDTDQAAWRERVAKAGMNVTPVMDRRYFHSIYFREPGGVLFEIATDPPGFGLDESVELLGTELKLPEWLEPRRGFIEERLPKLTVPAPGRVR